MYQIGEMVVYGGEGVCRVEAVGPLNLPGADKDRPYYTLAPLYRSGKVYTPVDTAAYMRPVLSRASAEALVRSIPEIQAAACGSSNPRVINEFYQQLMGSHSCADMIQLIKTAYRKRQEKHAADAKPSQVDERYMKRAEELLYGELAVSLGIPKDQVCAYIAGVVESASAC